MTLSAHRDPNHWINYANSFGQEDPRPLAFQQTANKFVKSVISNFNHTSRVNGLLFGQVQSGKTTHTFSVIAATADADPGFATFVYLTSNSIQLHEQTFGDAIERLNSTFQVCGPADETHFKRNKRKPNLVILNKDKSVLLKWIKILQADERTHSAPIFIIDDEGDSASQNTLVNKDEESRIYAQIKELRELGTASVYLQVTATPQALFLQSLLSGERPKFIHYFDPGSSYLGGDFFFSREDSITNKAISEDELEVLTSTKQATEGLKQALAFFVVVAAYFTNSGKTNANCLVHPAVRRDIHELIKDICKAELVKLLSPSPTKEYADYLYQALSDLNTKLTSPFTKEAFEAVHGRQLVINSVIINTDNKVHEDEYRDGFSVIVGANAIGRGVAFPHLQVVYYTRSAKAPQADTFWQHARIFGYDREWQAVRIFMPASLFRLFRVLQDQNSRLIELIKSGDLDKLQIGLPRGVNATRTQVIDKRAYRFVVGGTNYFPSDPNQDNAYEVDHELAAFAENAYTGPVSMSTVIKLIELAGEQSSEWRGKSLISAIKSLGPDAKAQLLMRKERRISSNTGSMLSPNDRAYGDGITNQVVVTAYRVFGKEGNWSKQRDFWLVNVKLPGNLVYHETV